jgi:hypothetical protein
MIPARESNLSFALPDAALPPIQSQSKIMRRNFGSHRIYMRRFRTIASATAAILE